jgi:hypothetical protein
MKKIVESVFNVLMPNDDEKEPAEPYSYKVAYIVFLVVTLILLIAVL